jgi:hypothetical protein
MKRRVQEMLRPRGLEIIGGGISNLEPLDDTVTQQRLKNWQTKWQGQIESRKSEGQAYRALTIEGAKAQVEEQNIAYLTKMAGQAPQHREGFYEMAVIIQFLKSLWGFDASDKTGLRSKSEEYLH